MVLLKRGMVKWQPFASLPEQSGYIKTALREQNKLAKPELSPEQQEELNRTILEAYHAQEPVVVSYYQDGYIHQVKGIIVKMDPIHQGIVIKCGNEQGQFAFSNIIAIELD